MRQKKKKIIEKIVKKNYNNELEEILETKEFSENVKSTLLNILYKIEASYKDLETVKKDDETKEEYITNLLNIIKNDCDSIKILKMSDEKNIIPKNKTYIVDKEKKEIIAYPIERKILYAIAKMGKKYKIIKDDYFIINETLSELINVGNNINMVEPLRDFNGYSWSCIPQEIESIEHNLVYQNLRILVGYKFLNKWINNSEFIIDYFDLFKEKLEEQYGTENTDRLVNILSNISILLSYKYNKDQKEKLTKTKEEIDEKLKKIQNREQFIEKTTQEKLKISDRIKEVDTIANDKNLLEKEYRTRNEKLPLDKKIFSLRILNKILEQERNEKVEELEKLNMILNPQKFIIYQKELEDKYECLRILNIEDKDKELENLKIQLQCLFLDMMKINIIKAETRQQIEKIIYDFRYYLLLPYSYEKKICEIEELKAKIEEIYKLIIDKSIDLKVIEKFSEDKQTNYDILKNLFTVRIIKLENAYLKITKEKDKYYLQILDENLFEEKVQIKKTEAFEFKINKKLSIWC